MGTPQRLHVVGLPHTQTTEAFATCAFTDNTRKFCRMMKDQGHTVFLYAGDQNEAPCDLLTTCVTEKERSEYLGAKHYTSASWDKTQPQWLRFNDNAIRAIRAHIEPHDVICIIGGSPQKQIAEAFPDHITVEYAIGYGGAFAEFKVFASYAWMHTYYACKSDGNAHDVFGTFGDAVIPHFFEPENFPRQARPDDYYLYVGRIIPYKGVGIAMQVCRELDVPLKIAGPTPPEGMEIFYGEYIGEVSPRERGWLMAGAKALFAPTLYIEPFGNVAVEAQLCGTPVIATDWGAFPETVTNGVSGYRCRTLNEFKASALAAPVLLNRDLIRRRAIDQFSLDAIGPRYTHYFDRLATLWDADWFPPR